MKERSFTQSDTSASNLAAGWYSREDMKVILHWNPCLATENRCHVTPRVDLPMPPQEED